MTYREDTHYYLEDNTYSIRLSFQELSYADPDAFFTENCILLVQGHYDNNEFKVSQLEHPPMHAKRSLRFKINEQDYFGAYAKMQRKQMQEHQVADRAHQVLLEDGSLVQQESEDHSIVVVNVLELDEPRQLKALEKLLDGLEMMRPKMIVCVGRFFSEQNNEIESFEKFKGYLEKFGGIVREKELANLRDFTEWIFIPAIDDPGQIRAMPSAPMSEYLLEGFMGKHLSSTSAKIKKVTLGCNPLRISFMGKEIVIARFNFLKKIQ